MNLLLLPDFVAITLLVYVLFRVRGGRNDSVIRLWTVGLLLTLLEEASRIVYQMQMPPAAHLWLHVLELNAYGLSGTAFLLSASQGLRRMPDGRLFLSLNILPHLLLFTAYGGNLAQPAVYWTVAGAGLLTGVVSPLLLRMRSPLYFAFGLIWAPLLLCVYHRSYFHAVCISMFFLYGLSALFFERSLPRGSHGRIAVVGGFAMWAVCLLAYAWIAAYRPEWSEMANHLCDMQKFVITVGLLLVLLEDQVRSNEWLALHDGLTGLPNRRLFEDRLQHALLNAERTRSRLALFLLDLDGFKQINDTLGHDAGDLLLKGISNNLLGALRRSDTLARLGGDEFTLLAAELDGALGNRTGILPSTGLPGVSCAAARLPQVQRILSAMSQAAEVPVCLGEVYDGRTVGISASIGVVVYPDEGTTAESLMRLADQRMYASKRGQARRGKQRVDGACPEYELERV